MLDPKLLNTLSQQQGVRKCPFCGGHFEGRPKYCPQCDKRLIKRGTSDQFINEVE